MINNDDYGNDFEFYFTNTYKRKIFELMRFTK